MEIFDSESFSCIKEFGIGLIGASHQISIKESEVKIGVLKVLRKFDLSIIQSIVQEQNQLNKLNHPNILKAYGVFLGDRNNHPSIIYEYCPRNLEKIIEDKTTSKSDKICMIYEIAQAMKTAHSLKIIHRDLKPSNIFVDSNIKIKIGDFGISKMMSPKEQLSFIDVYDKKQCFFIAPELKEDHFNEKSDVFSFGALMYFIINDGNIPEMTIFDYAECRTFKTPTSFTPFSKGLIEQCMSQNPDSRPDFENICKQILANMKDFLDLIENERLKIHELIGKVMK